MKEFYDFLSNNELTPNAHYVLYSMVYNLPIKGIPYASEQYKLSLNGFLEEHKSEVQGIFYTIIINMFEGVEYLIGVKL